MISLGVLFKDLFKLKFTSELFYLIGDSFYLTND